MSRNKELKVHSLRLMGRSLCSIRSNRKWSKRRGSSLQCQNCFFVYPISDCNLKNLFNSENRNLVYLYYTQLNNIIKIFLYIELPSSFLCNLYNRKIYILSKNKANLISINNFKKFFRPTQSVKTSTEYLSFGLNFGGL